MISKQFQKYCWNDSFHEYHRRNAVNFDELSSHFLIISDRIFEKSHGEQIKGSMKSIKSNGQEMKSTPDMTSIDERRFPPSFWPFTFEPDITFHISQRIHALITKLIRSSVYWFSFESIPLNARTIRNEPDHATHRVESIQQNHVDDDILIHWLFTSSETKFPNQNSEEWNESPTTSDNLSKFQFW